MFLHQEGKSFKSTKGESAPKPFLRSKSNLLSNININSKIYQGWINYLSFYRHRFSIDVRARN